MEGQFTDTEWKIFIETASVLDSVSETEWKTAEEIQCFVFNKHHIKIEIERVIHILYRLWESSIIPRKVIEGILVYKRN